MQRLSTHLAPWWRFVTVTVLALCALVVQAQPGDHGPDRPPGPPPRGQWWDGGHGHGHYYPAPGYVVHAPPPHARMVYWGGARYSFYNGVWYSPGPAGYVVVRPPYGVVVPVLPAFRTVVVIGGLSYFYANGVYYRDRIQGGYEVVAAPVAAVTGAAAPPPPLPAPATAPAKDFVYPRQGQSTEQQAGDEYECHRWAVSQTGFDPTGSATGTAASGDAAHRSDYQRARVACLDGRGYTVR